MKRTAFIAFTIVTFVYLIAGSVVFHFIEGGKEKKVKLDFARYHEHFLQSHPCVTPEALQEYVLKLLQAEGQGLDVSAVVSLNTTNVTAAMDNDLGETNWDLASTFLFCLTVISTIGYGNIAPKTEGGQLFCIFYALGGIPLFATTLVGCGERLQIPLKKIKKGRVWCKSNAQWDSQLKTCFFLSTGILTLIFIPAAVISRTENWTFIESLYFCIITLTTVGFGDYVPGYFNRINHGQYSGKHLSYLYRVMLAVWIMLGLAWIALILSEVASLLQDKIIRAARSTQSRLGDLEDIVKKKARETRERIVQKASTRRRSSGHKDKDKPSRTPVDDYSPTLTNQLEEPSRHKLEETPITANYDRTSAKDESTGDDDNKNLVTTTTSILPGSTTDVHDLI